MPCTRRQRLRPLRSRSVCTSADGARCSRFWYCSALGAIGWRCFGCPWALGLSTLGQQRPVCCFPVASASGPFIAAHHNVQHSKRPRNASGHGHCTQLGPTGAHMHAAYCNAHYTMRIIQGRLMPSAVHIKTIDKPRFETQNKCIYFNRNRAQVHTTQLKHTHPLALEFPTRLLNRTLKYCCNTRRGTVM